MATGSVVQIQEPEVTFEELAQSARKLRKLRVPANCASSCCRSPFIGLRRH